MTRAAASVVNTMRRIKRAATFSWVVDSAIAAAKRRSFTTNHNATTGWRGHPNILLSCHCVAAAAVASPKAYGSVHSEHHEAEQARHGVQLCHRLRRRRGTQNVLQQL